MWLDISSQKNDCTISLYEIVNLNTLQQLYDNWYLLKLQNFTTIENVVMITKIHVVGIDVFIDLLNVVLLRMRHTRGGDPPLCVSLTIKNVVDAKTPALTIETFSL